MNIRVQTQSNRGVYLYAQYYTSTNLTEYTYADIFLSAVRGERLRLKDKLSSRSKVKVDLTEESLYSIISPVEVNPLAQTQRENYIILWLLVV